jgi:hypothetical protein
MRAVSILGVCLVLTGQDLNAFGAPALVSAQHASRDSTLPFLVPPKDTTVLRGRITGPDSLPRKGVTVYARSTTTQVLRKADTDSRGMYLIVFPGGGKAFELIMQAVGMTTIKQQVSRVAGTDTIVTNAQLSAKNATGLQVVNVSADANIKPPDKSVGTNHAAEWSRDMLMKGTSGSEALETLPGVIAVPGSLGGLSGFSVFGAGASQNSILLDGSSTSNLNVPRDALGRRGESGIERFLTSPYDPAAGQFSGALVLMKSQRGNDKREHTLRTTLTPGAFQWTDPASRTLGQTSAIREASGSTSGPIVPGHVYYFGTAQYTRTTSDLQSLLNASPEALQRLGLSSDSVARLVALLQSAGIPSTVARVPNQRITDRLSTFAKIDFSKPWELDWKPVEGFGFRFNSDWNRQSAVGIGGTSLPATGGELTRSGFGLQFYAMKGQEANRNELRSFVQIDRRSGEPYLELPEGRVLLASTLADGSVGFASVGFGGNGYLLSRTSNSFWETVDELTHKWGRNHHHTKATAMLRVDRFTQDATANQFGTYFFNSLEDVATAAPTVFSRTLAPESRSATSIRSAASLGDSWRVTPRLQIQYGARVEADGYPTNPVYNAAVDSIFGRRNDRVPGEVHLSPRFGFTYSLGSSRRRDPIGMFTGGIGEFRGVNPPTLIASAIGSTGLATDSRQLFCIGSAAPYPDWSTYIGDPLAIPVTCANGETTNPFANVAPNVLLFDKGFAAPRSWRGNIAYEARRLLGLEGMIGFTYSRGVAQPSYFDLNFVGTPRFTLASEADRPVFANASSIVPGSGSVGMTDSRYTTAFSQVLAYRSDMQNEATQLSIYVRPRSRPLGITTGMWYNYGRVRERNRGFSGATTSGDPSRAEWGVSSYDRRHQIIGTIEQWIRLGGEEMIYFVSTGLRSIFTSGAPYTPLVAGDINGDGLSNDRAFVFNPATVSDPALASGMNDLLRVAPTETRDCLLQQMGRIASRGSCRTGWSASLDGQLRLQRIKNDREEGNVSLELTLTNILGGLDQMLHGSDNLRGWGAPAAPDQTLLQVRGFDPATQQFRYEVNSRFGETRHLERLLRRPTVLRLEARVGLGGIKDSDFLQRVLLDHDTLVTGQALKARLMRWKAQNVFAIALAWKDSLPLLPEQVPPLEQQARLYDAAVDSIFAPLVTYIDGLKGKMYDLDEVRWYWAKMDYGFLVVTKRFQAKLFEILTDAQIDDLPDHGIGDFFRTDEQYDRDQQSTAERIELRAKRRKKQ